MSFERPRPVESGDNFAGFDCNQPMLNDWLHRRALDSHAQGGARVYVTCWAGTTNVAGYYCLAPAAVAHRDVAGKIRRNMPDPIPVLLLGRLAVDGKAQGRGLGAELLRDAIVRCVQAADVIGGRAVLVHALDAGAAAFYARFGFDPSPTNELHMLLPMKDARAAAEQA
jgi:GNAT superfamily N-acetyltransferase